MRTRRQATISDLRRAVDCLPRSTRIAMLEGIATNEIIVGAYTNRDGVCPMLAAHRAGGRTSLVSFARAWDRFAFRDTRARGARRATERELLVLRTCLEASLMEGDVPAAVLGAAMAEHRELVARAADRAGRAADRGARGARDVDRSEELRIRERSSAVRVFRRYRGLKLLAGALEDDLRDHAGRR
jgi:hypothetical protein